MLKEVKLVFIFLNLYFYRDVKLCITLYDYKYMGGLIQLLLGLFFLKLAFKDCILPILKTINEVKLRHNLKNLVIFKNYQFNHLQSSTSTDFIIFSPLFI